MKNSRNTAIIDLHSHILPQMDDGSQDVETSAEMLRRLARQGVGAVYATPHFYADREGVDQFLCRRREALSRLTAAHTSETNAPWPKIRLGAEVAYVPGLAERTDLDALCLARTRTLLLELPYTQWTTRQVEEVAELCLDRGYQVILAHPERYAHMEQFQAHMERLLALPVAVQIDADSLVRWRSRRWAIRLLERGVFPLLGSDCHNLTTRPPLLEQARRVVKRRLGEQKLAEMDDTALAWTKSQAPDGREGRHP